MSHADIYEELETAAADGDLQRVRQLVEENGLTPDADPYDPVGAAAVCNHSEVAYYLLSSGWSPNRVDGNMSPLMRVASKGNYEMVRLLVEHGANVNHHLPNAPEWTAAMFASKEGHEEIAGWLARRQENVAPTTVPEAARKGGPLEKFAQLYRVELNGVNVGLDTDAIVRRLADWDARYGIHLLEPAHDRVTVQFDRLPTDLEGFAVEILDFCPDIIHQGYGAVAEWGGAVPEEIRKLTEGLDKKSDDFDVKVLARWLDKHQAVELWWD